MAAPRERAARQRKVVRYDYEDFDRNMRVRHLSSGFAAGQQRMCWCQQHTLLVADYQLFDSFVAS
jgi:hypothetical protein